MKKRIFVVDDFYLNPEEVRRVALTSEYERDDRYFKGHRSKECFAKDVIKDKFEQILGKRITNWDYPVNGKFQWGTADERVVYHCDTQQWAGAIYLTPDAPIEAGTSFFKSKFTGYRDCPPDTETINKTFQNGFYDGTAFDCVDKVGNVFNRCVLWDARMIHAASCYFGTGLENSRLVQIFFFDAE